MSDEAIQLTNTDASYSKLSAIQLGYWRDDYLKFFIKPTDQFECKKQPEINRGTFVRVKCIENIVKNFLNKCDNKSAQIINLGCGFDTLFWRLSDDSSCVIKLHNFIEIDFTSIVTKKVYDIKKNRQLSEKINEAKFVLTDLLSDNYNILGADLRNIHELECKLQKVSNLDFHKPTLILSECVLVYMKEESSENLIKYFQNVFKNALFVLYEMCNLNDFFGNVMIENIRKSKFGELLGLKSSASLDAQKLRFKNTGWEHVNAWILTHVYNSIRTDYIDRIEHLDETELLTQLLDHYCVCLASNCKLFASVDFL